MNLDERSALYNPSGLSEDWLTLPKLKKDKILEDFLGSFPFELKSWQKSW